MKNLRLVIDADTCNRCGACAKDCPAEVIVTSDGGIPVASPAKAGSCIECQHCLAVCPVGALSIFGLDPKNSILLDSGKLPTQTQMKTLVRGRRSVRQFQRKNIEKSLVEELLSDLAHVPTGCNDRGLEFLVVDDGAEMRNLLERIVTATENAINKECCVSDFLAASVRAYRNDGTDYFFRGAPHLLVVSSKKTATCGAQDVVLALSYFDLLAQASGIGTTWCGILDFAERAVPEIRGILGLDAEVPFYAMMFGYPAVKYFRTVQRDNAASIRRFHALESRTP